MYLSKLISCNGEENGSPLQCSWSNSLVPLFKTYLRAWHCFRGWICSYGWDKIVWFYLCTFSPAVPFAENVPVHTHTDTHTHTCFVVWSFLTFSTQCSKTQLLLQLFWIPTFSTHLRVPAAAPAKSLQSCPTLRNPIDSSPPGSPVPGILQARILEWVAISFSNAWKWKVKVKPLSRVRLLATPWTAAHQAPPSMGFSRQEYWSGVPLPSPTLYRGRSNKRECFPGP